MRAFYCGVKGDGEAVVEIPLAVVKTETRKSLRARDALRDTLESLSPFRLGSSNISTSNSGKVHE